MLHENAFLPFEPAELPRGPWLVFAPHADDETFGMGGTLLLGARQGVEVMVVVLTDGARGGEDEDLAALREAEAREAAERLGLREVVFWRQSDRDLRVTTALIQRVVALVQRKAPASVFFTAPGEPHPDHRAAAALVWEGLKRCEAFRGTAYAYEVSVQGPINRLIDITPVVSEKRDAMNLYRSQLAQHRYVEVVLGLNAARSYTLGADVTHAEGFYAYDAVEGGLAEQVMASLAVNWRAHQQGALSGPLVSVVIRTKDRPAMLREALRSLAAQNYSNLEAVVVNDGGQEVEDLVRGFDGDLIHRVCYVDLQPGRGRSAAANAGLERAAGDYLLFLDDDDLLLSSHIAALVNTLESRRDVGVAYAGVRCLRQDEAGEWQEFLIYNDAFDPVRLLYENYIPIHAALFRRGLIEEGCRFDENLNVYEDWDFWVQLSRKTPFLFVNQISAVYRIGVYGSFGAAGDSRFATRSIEEFFNKWRGLWSLDEVLHIRDRFFELRTSTERQLRDLTNQIHQLRDRSETRIRELDERIVAIYNSTSWRITAPIRFFRNTVLKIFSL